MTHTALLKRLSDEEAHEISQRWAVTTNKEKLAWHNHMAETCRAGAGMMYVKEILALANAQAADIKELVAALGFWLPKKSEVIADHIDAWEQCCALLERIGHE